MDNTTSPSYPNTSPILPAKEGSQLNFLYRQLFITPPAVPSSTNLTGKTAIVTGSNSGLGFHSARQLISLGLGKLILAVRSEDKGTKARSELLTLAKDANIEVWPLDMSSYDSIVAFAQRCRTLGRLDFAILNAGYFPARWKTNAHTGHEEATQVNHLSTSLLTVLLLPVMRDLHGSGSIGRIVLVNSETAAWAKFTGRNSPSLLEAVDTPPSKHNMEETYYMSKLLNQLWFAQLCRRVPATAGVVITMLNPGLCYGSALHRDVGGAGGVIFARLKRLIGRTMDEGARTLTDAAVCHGDEVHGQYLGDCVIKPLAPLIYTPEGEEIGERLWKETMRELAFVDAEEVVQGLART